MSKVEININQNVAVEWRGVLDEAVKSLTFSTLMSDSCMRFIQLGYCNLEVATC